MHRQLLRSVYLVASLCGALRAAEGPATSPDDASSTPRIAMPLEREAYFIGERVPLAVASVPTNREITLALVHADGRVPLYKGRPVTLLLDTSLLAPGEYTFDVNGVRVNERMFLTSPLRRSAASLQDECTPSQPTFDSKHRYTPDERAVIERRHWDHVAKNLSDCGVTCLMGLGQSDLGRAAYLDVLARAGTMLMVNPDTRPTSFFPVGNLPREIDDMSQRMILTAQANGRYPNFAGFCFGWDTTGYAIGNRRGLLQYWGWGNKTDALRHYLQNVDRHTEAEFTRRTGLAPVREAEYIAYLLSLRRPEFAPAIDLPSKLWLEEIAAHTRPLTPAQQIDFEQRLDAWSSYLMGLYAEAYGAFAANLHEIDPSLRHTASVQVDHAAVRFGQYFPIAYAPLDFQYQTTWNDQVGGPDYAYQWLFTAGLLNMNRGAKPTWLSNCFGPVHGRAELPGKFVRVAAHGLAWGVSGVGFALEGFSNLMGGMNKQSQWDQIEGTAGESDVLAGREFLERFAALAVEGRGAHGVGILFSRTQYQRQHITMGFGTAPYKVFIALMRLGYTPRFVTEEELAVGTPAGIEALLVVGQTFALPAPVLASLEQFVTAGGRVLMDGGTSVDLPNAQRLDVTLPFTEPGKPHNWSVPNLASGDNDALRSARWHRELAPALLAGLGTTGRGLFASAQGAEAQASLTQISAGPDATYVIAVNDSHIKTQADWHQVRERLQPTPKADRAAVLYDCTAEQLLGKVGDIDCDLMLTTARVFAVLKRPLKSIELSATQSLCAGETMIARVRFLDEKGRPLAAVLPFHLALRRPDGKIHQEFYRATDREGRFILSLRIPINAPVGQWGVEVRSQLIGELATLPLQIAAGRPADLATTWNESVVVRQHAVIEQVLAKDSKPLLPVFTSAGIPPLLAVAHKLQADLARRGVQVEVIENPCIGTYWLTYDPTDEQKAENARVDSGEMIGKIQRQTVNGNDWYSAQSGYRCGRPLILLDLAARPADNPLTQSLAGTAKKAGATGLLWPQVTEHFPGRGRAVVQGISWCFAPHVPTLVIGAMDIDGLIAGADALANLPQDRLTPAIESLRAGLWREHHVGGRPPAAPATTLTSQGLSSRQAPQPFAIRFRGDKRPLRADEIERPKPVARAALTIPGVFGPKQFVPFIRDGNRFIEAATVGFLYPDLRFSEAIGLSLDVPQPGKTKISIGGVFRYADRDPAWQAVWEDVLELHKRLVPRQRRPMEIDVLIDGKPVGKLLAAKIETVEVPVELRSPTAGTKPRTVREEAVTQIGGELDLPPGRHDLLLIHRNIVDGKVQAISIGAELPPASQPPR